MSSEPTPSAAPIELRVPIATIVKVLVTAAVVWSVLRLLPSLFLLLFAILLALTLSPAVDRLERRGLSRGIAVVAIAAAMILVLAAFAVFVVPPLVSQTVEVVSRLPVYKAHVEQRVAAEHPLLARLIVQVLELPTLPEVAKSLKRPLAWGQMAVEGVVAGGLVLVLTLYLLVDGKRTYAWLLAYVPRRLRRKMSLTVPEMSDVVLAYMQGQLLTSVLAGLWALGVLAAFRVPAAVPLAVLAAVCDVLPIVGLVVSIVPAVLFALTVSPGAALGVFALYIVYHALENYILIPRVYGKRLRLSTLVVLIALVLGGSLYGVLGAILALPLFAAYPIIEKIWLHDYLSDEVVADHGVLEATAEDGSDRAVEAVLRGERHAAERDRSARNAARAARRSARKS